MKRLAEWHATQEGRVKFKETQQMAWQLAGVYVTPGAIRTLLNREDWLTYREEIAVDEMLALKRRVEARYQDYADAHHEALMNLRKAEKWKDVAEIAAPIIDRIAPKREERGPGQNTFIVNLGGSTPTVEHIMSDVEDAQVLEVIEAPKPLPPSPT